MSDRFYLDPLLKTKEKAPLLRKAFLFFYLTYMAVPWFMAYSIVLYIAWYETSDPNMAAFISTIGILLGAVFFIMMISGFARDRSEVQDLRDIYFDFADNFAKDLSKCSKETVNSFRDFQNVFVHVCPRQTKPVKPTDDPYATS